ncbi:hypothetical protein PMAYCL1PPCAC_05137 [Pristionchus mayeri]|uniref:Uncharacterized protein n=1 Tax=Pristionchus mayeri TaxID=1317129 RepID=A0AAN4Z5N7_9BILA|nr:hypothetical protein PMAYCL1PPCAC_05137 [Pristionchus mayeri]
MLFLKSVLKSIKADELTLKDSLRSRFSNTLMYVLQLNTFKRLILPSFMVSYGFSESLNKAFFNRVTEIVPEVLVTEENFDHEFCREMKNQLISTDQINVQFDFEDVGHTTRFSITRKN